MKKSLVLVCLVAAAACGGSKAPGGPDPVVASYNGSWSGTYAITSCSQNGDVALADICGILGSTPPYAMSLAQSGRNVSGTFRLGAVDFPSTGGTVANDGTLQLNALANNSGVTIDVTWNLSMAGTQLGGTVAQQWASSGLSGRANVSGRITSASHAASLSALPGATFGGLTLGGLAQLAGR